MTNDQITSLAREYAEFTDMSLVDKKNISAICECFLKYTLRRYCLVEKSKVEEELETSTHNYEAAEHFDTIVKSDFRNERRLNIAAKIVASMVGSDDWTTWRGGSNKEIWHNMAKSSLEIADALISECNKGGKE